MKNYLVVQKWSFGEKTTKYSAMVRADQMIREEALKRAEQEEHGSISGTFNEFIKVLEIGPNYIEEAKHKTHLKFLG